MKPDGAPEMSNGWSDLVDLHSHVLPSVDDGAHDDETALQMLRVAQEDGVVAIAATPHAHRIAPERVEVGVARLNGLAREAGLAIRVMPGTEVRIAADLLERHRTGKLITLNGTRYLLLEAPLSGPWPRYLPQVVDQLHAEGVLPILAHAERYDDIQRHPELLLELIAAGVPIQVNADSLSRRAERGARPAAETLLRHHMVHIIASDAHHPQWRPPRLSEALAVAAEVAGRDYADWVAANSGKVIRGEALTLPAPRLPIVNGVGAIESV
ncbi:MAG TPA: CpsB/CapC family capsule biosynthesis tyrosine phosphatase [Thermomicrobiaceae bacterium]|nr:CpsB/CapC family capsule biosynthesis tyrosine phosphatase [Thermomicrobiaceae bacterium]